MQKLPVSVPLGLFVLLTLVATGSCSKGMSKEEIRRLVRDEVQEQLRERKRRQAPRPPAGSPLTPTPRTRPASAQSADPTQRRVERLRRRIQTLDALVARFSKSPGVDKKRVAMMKKQLATMRERLTRLEGGKPETQPPLSRPTPLGTGRLTRKDWFDALAAGIRPLGKQRWEIDRRILLAILKNPDNASKDAKIMPHLVGGKTRGFKLGGLRPKGLFTALGLKAGDAIERVNNTQLTSPKQAQSIFAGLSKARLVTVLVRRSGSRIVHVYTIKSR